MKALFVIFLFFLLGCAAASASVGNITGKVTDKNGKPLPQVNIEIKNPADGKSAGKTETDRRGIFILKSEEAADYDLQISCVGFAPYRALLRKTAAEVDLETIHLETDTLALSEVVVRADSRIREADRQIVFPKKHQRESSTSGYSLLRKLALPGIRTDETSHTVTSNAANGGTVQIRINNVPATKEDVLAMDAKRVKRVEYIDKPGLEYGQNLGAIINFIVSRPTEGISCGLDLTNSPAGTLGSNNLYFKFNKGAGQWTANYSADYKNFKKQAADETAEYRLLDNTLHRIRRTGQPAPFLEIIHTAQLTYNLNLHDRHVFQAGIQGIFDHQPQNRTLQAVTETGRAGYTSETNSRNTAANPVLDLYYETVLPHGQLLRASTVLSYIRSDYSYDYKEYTSAESPTLADYGYTTTGRKFSVIGELAYQRKFKSVNLSAGIQYLQNQLENRYKNDTETLSAMRNANLYSYLQLTGSLAKFGFTAGIGLSRQHNEQGQTQYDYWTFRPVATLNYPLSKTISVGYQFKIIPHLPQLANLTGVRLQRNVFEVFVGNPSLTPFRNVIHSLSVSHQSPRVYAQWQQVYIRSGHAVMPTTTRSLAPNGNTLFEYGSENQRGTSQLSEQIYVQWDILPQTLTVTGSGGANWFFSRGNAYSHNYAALSGSLQMSLYLGKWAVDAGADSRYPAFFGETLWLGEYTNSINLSYRLKNAQFRLGWSFPLQTRGQNSGEETNSQFVNKKTWATVGDFSNLVTLNFTWKMHAGRKYAEKEKEINNRDGDAGIVK